MKNKLTGTGVAMVTPFTASGDVDYPALEKFTEYLISGSVDYLVVHGTTGEAATLTAEEKEKTLHTILKINNDRLPVVVGVGGNNTIAVVNKLSTINMEGVCAILSVCPYYNKPSQEGVFQHYKMIAEHTDLPIIIYNVPGRTSCNILAETTLRIAELPNIVGVKEASGDLNQIMEIIKEKPKDFLVISGDDAIALPIIAAGGIGVISVVANAYPKDFSKLVNHCLLCDYQSAQNIQYTLIPIINSLFADGNPSGIKKALSTMGLIKNILRLPLVPVNEVTAAQIERLIINTKFVTT